CASTIRPSSRSRTSKSPRSQPNATPLRSDRSVFSRSSAAAPLWPIRSGRPSPLSLTAPSRTAHDDDRAIVAQLAADEAAALVQHDLGEGFCRQPVLPSEEGVQALLAVQLPCPTRLDDAVRVQDDSRARLERPAQLGVRLAGL